MIKDTVPAKEHFLRGPRFHKGNSSGTMTNAFGSLVVELAYSVIKDEIIWVKPDKIAEV